MNQFESTISTTTQSTDTNIMKTFNNIQFHNRNLINLPVDKEITNYCREVKNSIFSRVNPQPIINPKLIAYSNSALQLLGLSNQNNELDNQLLEYLSGNKVIPGSDPAAHCYCGHQFGSFAGQLGDGAAISLGEVINPLNERWELQLKGAGTTPYSRNSDGRKVLRSSIREFLASEFMHGLGIPTTRSATCISSDSTVVRDPMYEGKPINEPCTVISRIAPNFFRFGSFEIFKPKDPFDGPYGREGPSVHNQALKKQLLDHILLYYPHIQSSTNDKTDVYITWFKEVIDRTIQLVARWQAVGFVHGVLNTDNMSIMGLTIDYGPYAFMEAYDSDYVSNGSDGSGKYAFKHQPAVVKWNLKRLAEAIDPLVDLATGYEIIEEVYDNHYESIYQSIISDKLGISQSIRESNDPKLVDDLLETMQETHADYTDTFYALTLYISDIETNRLSSNEARELLINRILDRCFDSSAVIGLLKRKMRIHRLGMKPQQVQQLWEIVSNESEEAVSEMFNGAPADAIKREIGEEKRKLDIQMSCARDIELYQTLPTNQKKLIDREKWIVWIDRYLKCIDLDKTNIQRLDKMRSKNPSFMLRNWILQDAIDAASNEDYDKVRKLLEMSLSPYDPKYSTFTTSTNDNNNIVSSYCRKTPSNVTDLICTCSS